MDEYTSVPDHPFARQADDSTAAAEAIHRDFTALLSMLDRQLSNVKCSDELARAHILEARTAAIRGLTLSARLVDLMGKGSDQND